MGNNLIHNYLNNMNDSKSANSPTKRNEMSRYIPTMNSFDQSSDKLIKPLDGKGHLVNGDLVHMPKEFVRDTVYTTKALADGVRGKANDHQLGKLNDLGLKIGGLAIATYLMTRKGTLKTKAMEFVGFGAFLASMALWPKIALEIPARIIHGFNFRKQYIDEQGRKKFVSQDPNYIPFDLYKGDKKSEDLDVIGDRAGIRRDIPNRHEAVKEHMRKVSVQNNTLWMLTAGIATPLMTALACNKAEKWITPKAEQYTNKKVNNEIDQIDDYLNNNMKDAQKAKYESEVLKINGKNVKSNPVETILSSVKGQTITKDKLVELSDTVAAGFDAEMKDAAREDISRLLGGERYIADSKAADRMTSAIHSAISAKDTELAARLTPDKLKTAVSEGIVRGAVRDMLTDVGVEILDNEKDFGWVSDNFKRKEIADYDFFKVTAETEHMTPTERLAHNIKSIVMKVNNSNTSEDFIPGMSELEGKNKGLKARIDAKLQADAESIAQRFYSGELGISSGRESYIRTSVGKLFKSEAAELAKDSTASEDIKAARKIKTKKLFSEIGEVLTEETSTHKGYVVSEKGAATISKTFAALRKFSAIDGVLSTSAHFKVEKANETLVANNWGEVSELLVKKLGITDKELSVASRDKAYSNRLFAEKLEQVCANDKTYKNFITEIATKMAELDEKMDAPNAGKEGRMMDKIKNGITTSCTQCGDSLGELGMSEMKQKMVSSECGKLGGIRTGSVLNSRTERLVSRVDGVHSSYMRLLEVAEFFRRSEKYHKALNDPNIEKNKAFFESFGLTENMAKNEEILAKGKEVLLDAHTNKFYTKMGLQHNPKFFKDLMTALYKPALGENKCAQETVDILDAIKVGEDAPRRVFEGEGRKPLGKKLMEHMDYVHNNMGSIERGVLDKGKETVKVDNMVSEAERRACKRFNLLGKAPNDFLHDTLKQVYNSRKWMKTFAPILAGTFGLTLLAQFFFGKKDKDIKA